MLPECQTDPIDSAAKIRGGHTFDLNDERKKILAEEMHEIQTDEDDFDCTLANCRRFLHSLMSGKIQRWPGETEGFIYVSLPKAVIQ